MVAATAVAAAAAPVPPSLPPPRRRDGRGQGRGEQEGHAEEEARRTRRTHEGRRRWMRHPRHHSIEPAKRRADADGGGDGCRQARGHGGGRDLQRHGWRKPPPSSPSVDPHDFHCFHCLHCLQEAFNFSGNTQTKSSENGRRDRNRKRWSTSRRLYKRSITRYPPRHPLRYSNIGNDYYDNIGYSDRKNGGPGGDYDDDCDGDAGNLVGCNQTENLASDRPVAEGHRAHPIITYRRDIHHIIFKAVEGQSLLKLRGVARLEQELLLGSTSQTTKAHQKKPAAPPRAALRPPMMIGSTTQVRARQATHYLPR